MSLARLARSIIPFPIRVEIVRLRRLSKWVSERPAMALSKDENEYSYLWAQETSPLRRAGITKDERLQQGKEANIALAARKISGILIGPGQTFSYHHAVGRPSRLRGFRKGLELHDSKESAGVGGGCCQVSNLLYLLALKSGMEVVERHRHSLDLFPDSNRTVPFGCGATVFFNSADFRFRNPIDTPVQLVLHVEEGALIGEIRSTKTPSLQIEVLEMDHRFWEEEGTWFRENRIVRRYQDLAGLTWEEEVGHNRAKCLYIPEVSQ